MMIEYTSLQLPRIEEKFDRHNVLLFSHMSSLNLDKIRFMRRSAVCFLGLRGGTVGNERPGSCYKEGASFPSFYFYSCVNAEM